MADDRDPTRRDVLCTSLAVGAVSSGLLPSSADAAASAPSPERAQDLIDRIAAIPLAPPHIDERRVDAAMQQALDAAGMARRPLRWFADPASAHRHVYAVGHAAAHEAARDAVTTDLDIPAWHAAMAATWDFTWRDAHRDAPEAARRAALDVWRKDWSARERRKEALLAGYKAAEAAMHHRLLDAALRAASGAAQEIAHRASTAAHKAPPNGRDGEIDKAAAWATWRMVARRSGAWLAHDGAVSAVGELGALQVFDHPAQVAAVHIFRPLVDAMAAGLFCYWVGPHEVVCVPRPAFYPVGGELHGVAWATGETYNLRNWLMHDPLV
jgi:hypothetical protein